MGKVGVTVAAQGFDGNSRYARYLLVYTGYSNVLRKAYAVPTVCIERPVYPAGVHLPPFRGLILWVLRLARKPGLSSGRRYEQAKGTVFLFLDYTKTILLDLSTSLFTLCSWLERFPFTGNFHSYGNFYKIEIDGIL